MASVNTVALRDAHANLRPTPRWLIRRAASPIGKTGLFRIRTTAAPDAEMDTATGAHRNPARHMTEAERRAQGLRRNGKLRRAARTAAA